MANKRGDILATVYRGVWSAIAAAAAAIAILSTAPASNAADSIYWVNGFPGAADLSSAALDGSGGSTLYSGLTLFDDPFGITINPADEIIYWSNIARDDIVRANLDGCCVDMIFAGSSGPTGLTVDPQHDRFYWANANGNTISVSTLDGQNATTLDTTGAPVSGPFAIAADPANNKIYWTNSVSSNIGYANLDGTGNAGTFNSSFGPISSPLGIAVDPTHNRLYWTDTDNDQIAYASLDGSGNESGVFNTDTAPILDPVGIAVDAEENRLYWSSSATNEIAYANLDGTGNGGTLNTAGALTLYPYSIAILKQPVAEGTTAASPAISEVGSTLTCTPPEWQNNIVESQLFNAPAGPDAYQWSLNGNVIPGATTASLTTSEPGRYTCTATASNQAGATSSTSNAVAVNSPPTPPTPAPTPTPTPTPSPTPAPSCPTVKATITKPVGKRGRNRAGSSRQGVRLIATTNVTADLNITATGTYNSGGRTRKVTLVPVSNMQVGTQGRRFALFTPSSIKRGQELKLRINVTPTPAISGCKAQAASTSSQSRTVTKIVT